MTAIQTQPTNAMTRPVDADMVSVTQILQRLGHIQELFNAVFKENIDFGVIPGTGGKKDKDGNPIPDRPSLLKPGAELICTLFRLSATYSTTRTDLPMNHREIETVCTLTHIPTGDVWGQGLGVASTMESKHRYRGTGSEPTGEVLSKQTIDAYWTAHKAGDWRQKSKIIGGDRFTLVKNKSTGVWEKHEKSAEKRENPDPADQYHTVMSMSCKRSLVAAVRTATGCSRMFEAQIDDDDMQLIGEPADDARQVESTPVKTANTVPAPAQFTPEDAAKAIAQFATIGVTEADLVGYTETPVAGWEPSTREILLRLHSLIKSFDKWKPTVAQLVKYVGGLPVGQWRDGQLNLLRELRGLLLEESTSPAQLGWEKPADEPAVDAASTTAAAESGELIPGTTEQAASTEPHRGKRK